MSKSRSILKIGLVQMNSTDSVEENFQQIKQILERDCRGQQVDGIVFPENSLFLKIKKHTKNQALSLKDPIFEQLSELSSQYKTEIFLTTPLKEKQKIYNATLWFSPKTPPLIIYKKIHLFDVAIDESHFIRESSVFSAGTRPQIIQWLGWKIGFCICYDLRFSELCFFYGKAGVDLIFVPSAFLQSTGAKHWEILLRARAIENQCYVLAPAQSGRHVSYQDESSVRFTYGHSLCISPQGGILYNMKQAGPQLKIISLKKDDILKFRKQIPMKKHRKLR